MKRSASPRADSATQVAPIGSRCWRRLAAEVLHATGNRSRLPAEARRALGWFGDTELGFALGQLNPEPGGGVDDRNIDTADGDDRIGAHEYVGHAAS